MTTTDLLNAVTVAKAAVTAYKASQAKTASAKAASAKPITLAESLQKVQAEKDAAQMLKEAHMLMSADGVTTCPRCGGHGVI